MFYENYTLIDKNTIIQEKELYSNKKFVFFIEEEDMYLMGAHAYELSGYQALIKILSDTKNYSKECFEKIQDEYFESLVEYRLVAVEILKKYLSTDFLKKVAEKGLTCDLLVECYTNEAVIELKEVLENEQ